MLSRSFGRTSGKSRICGIDNICSGQCGCSGRFTRHTLVAEYNSPDSVKALFEAYPDEIAAIIVEPVAANMGVVPPADGFLEFLR